MEEGLRLECQEESHSPCMVSRPGVPAGPWVNLSVCRCAIPELVPDRMRVPVAHGVGNIAVPLKHHSLEES